MKAESKYCLKKMTKIVIWGHKIHSHTHSYIHACFYKAFKYMGYETYWFDNSDIINIDLSNSLFITEGQVDENIPKRKDCLYLLHNCEGHKYTDLKKIGLQTYTADRSNGSKQYVHFDGNTITMCWATDLMPNEINTDANNNNFNLKKIYWVGTIGDGEFGNINEINPFINKCKKNNIEFIHSNPWSKPKSFEENRDMIINSYLAPTIVGRWQKENHYIPCRIFKNISYGKIGLTNSLAIKEMFGEMVTYSNDTSELFDLGVTKMLSMKSEEMKEAMEFVKSNHTYVNRCEFIKKCFEI